MSRWIGIVLVVVLYLLFEKKLDGHLFDNDKTHIASSNGFPKIERQVVNASRPSPAVMNKLTEKNDHRNQCFSDMFIDIKCDVDCWSKSMELQGTKLSELALRDWKKQDPKFDPRNHSDIYNLYEALNSVGLLSGGDQPLKPTFDKAISLLQDLSAKEPQNYYPYLLLALVYDKKGDSVGIQQALQQMDQSATHYNNYYSSWFAQLEKDSAESLETFIRGISVGSEVPIPSINRFLDLSKKYVFDKKKMARAMVLSVENFKNKHKYSILSVSLVDFMLAAHLVNDPKLKARKNEMFNPGLNRFLYKFSSDFPEVCERSAVEAWFQKHRSEIQ